jgi:hypothetical protein
MQTATQKVITWAQCESHSHIAGSAISRPHDRSPCAHTHTHTRRWREKRDFKWAQKSARTREQIRHGCRPVLLERELIKNWSCARMGQKDHFHARCSFPAARDREMKTSIDVLIGHNEVINASGGNACWYSQLFPARQHDTTTDVEQTKYYIPHLSPHIYLKRASVYWA